jgi:hypothetical protein
LHRRLAIAYGKVRGNVATTLVSEATTSVSEATTSVSEATTSVSGATTSVSEATTSKFDEALMTSYLPVLDADMLETLEEDLISDEGLQLQMASKISIILGLGFPIPKQFFRSGF